MLNVDISLVHTYTKLKKKIVEMLFLWASSERKETMRQSSWVVLRDFPNPKFEKYVFSKQPLKSGERIVAASNKSLFRKWSSGVLITDKAFIEWKNKIISRYEFELISKIVIDEKTALLMDINFEYKGEEIGVELYIDDRLIASIQEVFKNDIVLPNDFTDTDADTDATPKTKNEFFDQVNNHPDKPVMVMCSIYKDSSSLFKTTPSLPAMSTISVYFTSNYFYLYGTKKGGAAKVADSVGGFLAGPILGGIVSTLSDEDEIIMKIPWSDVKRAMADDYIRAFMILAKVDDEEFLISLKVIGGMKSSIVNKLKKYVTVETH